MWQRRNYWLVGLLVFAGCESHQPDEQIGYGSAPPSFYRPLQAQPPARPAAGPQTARRLPPPPVPSEAWPPQSGRISRRWSTVVIHHSATDKGSAATFDKFHRSKGWDELGYHFVIGNGSETPDGLIEVGARWHKQKHGAHCKTPDQYFNEHGIGICLVGDFTKRPPTARQMQSLSRLVNYLSYACNIPPDRITTHGLVNPKTQCPGPMFSLGAVRARMGGPASAASYRR